jgi:hypothetical protein
MPKFFKKIQFLNVNGKRYQTIPESVFINNVNDNAKNILFDNMSLFEKYNIIQIGTQKRSNNAAATIDGMRIFSLSTDEDKNKIEVIVNKINNMLINSISNRLKPLTFINFKSIKPR